MLGHCFEKCVTKPGSKLDSSEEVKPYWLIVFPIPTPAHNNTVMCSVAFIDRYMEAWTATARAYADKLQKST